MKYKNKKKLIWDLITSSDTVLDVGFWGQGTPSDASNWVHAILKSTGAQVYGVDLDFDENKVVPQDHYYKGTAESVNFPISFTKIFAGDLIEHLSNPGLFLNACERILTADGRLIITTPNTFNLFNIAEKISKQEPTVNADHTFYFNSKTLRTLLYKNNFEIESVGYVYTLEPNFVPSWKKKLLDGIYFLLSLVTDKFLETLVIVAKKRS